MATYGSMHGDLQPESRRLDYLRRAVATLSTGKRRLGSKAGHLTYRVWRSYLQTAAKPGRWRQSGREVLRRASRAPEVALRPQASCSWRGRAYRRFCRCLTAARSLLRVYSYGDKLSEMLRDRLVCGVNHNGIQRKL